MQQGAKTVPEQIAMQFGPDEAKSFIVASFSEAARGIKGWAGGAVQKNYKTNPNFTESMALADRESRMITFASIVQLERSGTLAKIFAGQSLRGDDGLGAVPLAVVIIAAAVAVTAVALCAYEAIRQSALNKKIDKLCEMDEALCKQVLAETIREEASSSPLASGARTLGTALGIGIVAYVGATVVLPKLLAGKRSE
jgi:hypothetical protein